jgi:sugar lactone lactonase YvrE
VDRLKKLLETASDKCWVTYEIARTYAFGRQYPETMDWLSRAISLNVGFDPSHDPVFERLRDAREFQDLVRRARDNTPAVLKSRIAFEITEADLFPENLAYDARSKLFYFGSAFKNKIVRCDSKGACQPFVSSNRDGLGFVLGLKIDPESQTLWTTSNGSTGAGLFHHSLASGKLIRKYLLAGHHLFNDLAITSRGDVFVTDTKAGAVYWIPQAAGTLEEFAPQRKFTAANGIALSPDEKTLYVAAFGDGISVVDIGSRSTHALTHSSDVCFAYIDGLYAERDSLIAIQNGPMSPRVVRFYLNSERNRIDRCEILERRNPLFDGVTTGVPTEGKFYYMANNQLDQVVNGKIKPSVRLNAIKILEIALDSR